MIDCPFIPLNATRLFLQHRPKSLVRSDPANHIKGANRQRPSSNLRQACGQNVQTAVFNLKEQRIRSSHKPDRKRSFPIDTAQPPRLPP